MQMHAKRVLQIVTVVFALSVLTAYVVHSQLRPVRSMTRSSTPPAPLDAAVQRASKTKPGTVSAPQPVPQTLAPGSKYMAPVLAIEPARKSAESAAPIADEEHFLVASGSKSAPVIDMRQKGLPKWLMPSVPLQSARSTNATSAAKP